MLPRPIHEVRLQELAFNNSPCFEVEDDPVSYLRLVGAALGPPPPGIFLPECDLRTGRRLTACLLKEQLLPEGRNLLAPLRLLSLRCLNWLSQQRPTAQDCYEQISSCVTAGVSAPSFAAQWQVHSVTVQQDLSSTAKCVRATQPEAGFEQPIKEVAAANSETESAALATNLQVPTAPPGLTFLVTQGTAAPAAVSAKLTIPAAAEPRPSSQIPETATISFARMQAQHQGFQALLPSVSLLQGYDSDDCTSPDIIAAAQAVNSRGTAEPVSASTGSVLTACACDQKKNCGFHDGAVCPNYTLPGSSFCHKCECVVEGCAGKQLLATGYCCSHIFRTASTELQLVRALGMAVAPQPVEEALRPADIQVLDKVIADYIQKHDILDPVFQVVAVWLEDPGWVETWSKNSLPRSSSPLDLVQALHKTIKEMSGHDIPEARYKLHDERCSGFSNCCFQLKVAAEVPPDAVEPVPSSELVYNIGRSKATWRLLTDRARG